MKFNYGVCVGAAEHEKIKAASKVGYKFVEPPFAGFENLGEGEIADFGALVRDLGMTVASANCFLPGRIKVVGPERDDEEIKEYLATVFEKTAPLGIKSIIFGSGGARKVPDGYPREKAKEEIASFLSELVLPFAKKYDTVVGIEELNSGETNIINTCAEAMEYVREVNDAHVGLLVDLFHVGRMKEPVKSLEAYGKYISHVHIASPTNGRTVPLAGDGDEELYREFFRILHDAGYKAMNISLEGGFGEDFAETVAKSIAYLGEVEKMI